MSRMSTVAENGKGIKTTYSYRLMDRSKPAFGITKIIHFTTIVYCIVYRVIYEPGYIFLFIYPDTNKR